MDVARSTMTPAAYTEPDLRWISQRCCALYLNVARLAAPDLAALEVGLQEVGSPNQVKDARGFTRDIEALCEAMGLHAPQWTSRPDPDLFPMLGHVPGVGWGFLLGVGARGEWHFESARGVERLDPRWHEDADPSKATLFTPIRPLSIGSHMGPGTARSLFRHALVQRWPVFAVAAGAALCANLLALAGSLYSMQVYDRVIPTQGLSTLTVLTIGVGLACLLELAIKLIRSRLLEEAVKRIDLSASQNIFERITRIRMDQFPRSVGNLSSQLRSYEAIRGFLASATMYLAADAPFALLFLLVIVAIGGPELALVPLLFAAAAIDALGCTPKALRPWPTGSSGCWLKRWKTPKVSKPMAAAGGNRRFGAP
jgi:ATP-binding cassette, subfamily C, bacterial LapB